MARYPREIVVKKYLSWQLRDALTQKRLSQKCLNQLSESGKKVVVVDAKSNEYIAGHALDKIAAIEAVQRKRFETVHPIAGFKGYLNQAFVDIRTWKPVSRRHLKLLAENGTKVIVVDTTTNDYKDRLGASKKETKWEQTEAPGRPLNILEGHAQRPNILTRWQLVQPYLERRQRTAWAAAEAAIVGYGGGLLLSQITGIRKRNINFWRRRLEKTKYTVAGSLARQAPPKTGGKPIEKIDPEIIPALECASTVLR